jgi:hypothetical protein
MAFLRKQVGFISDKLQVSDAYSMLHKGIRRGNLEPANRRWATIAFEAAWMLFQAGHGRAALLRLRNIATEDVAPLDAVEYVHRKLKGADSVITATRKFDKKAELDIPVLWDIVRDAVHKLLLCPKVRWSPLSHFGAFLDLAARSLSLSLCHQSRFMDNLLLDILRELDTVKPVRPARIFDDRGHFSVGDTDNERAFVTEAMRLVITNDHKMTKGFFDCCMANTNWFQRNTAEALFETWKETGSQLAVVHAAVHICHCLRGNHLLTFPLEREYPRVSDAKSSMTLSHANPEHKAFLDTFSYEVLSTRGLVSLGLTADEEHVIFDKHTTRGCRRGHGYRHFFEHGAVTLPQPFVDPYAERVAKWLIDEESKGLVSVRQVYERIRAAWGLGGEFKPGKPVFNPKPKAPAQAAAIKDKKRPAEDAKATVPRIVIEDSVPALEPELDIYSLGRGPAADVLSDPGVNHDDEPVPDYDDLFASAGPAVAGSSEEDAKLPAPAPAKRHKAVVRIDLTGVPGAEVEVTGASKPTETTCCVCWERPPVMGIAHRANLDMHVCLCLECSDSKAVMDSFHGRCPICREAISSLYRVRVC